MWYFSWILGVSLACTFGILNAMWNEVSMGEAGENDRQARVVQWCTLQDILDIGAVELAIGGIGFETTGGQAVGIPMEKVLIEPTDGEGERHLVDGQVVVTFSTAGRQKQGEGPRKDTGP